MTMDSQPAAAVPQYAKIAADLREKIISGFYGPGALLPSRNEITTMYGVSAITARDALSVLSHEGYAKAIRGRGHIVRRKRSRLTVPARLYSAAGPDPAVPLELDRLDVYQESPPDNIALPLETGSHTAVWVRRAVSAAAADRQPMQIHVSWLPGLADDAAAALRGVRADAAWPAAVAEVTGRTVATVVQHTRARGANPWEAGALGIPDTTIVLVTHATLYDGQRRPVEHSRYTWPTDAARISDYYTYAPPTG
jgi:DNA-binding GntR family transcriptional regulator